MPWVLDVDPTVAFDFLQTVARWLLGSKQQPVAPSRIRAVFPDQNSLR
jgi:hypothetical protein